MSISWSSISAGAMTAAVSLGSTVQTMGAAAAQALPAVTGGGIQAVGHQAATAATNVAATAATTLPQSAGAASVATSQVAESITAVEKPAKALAAAAPKASFLTRTAGFLSKALPVVTIGASALAGAQIVNEKGAQGLITTKQGRGAVLGAIGGAFMLIPTPVTQLAAAGVLGGMAVNHFGGLDRLDTAHVRMPWDPKGTARPPAA